MLNQDAKIVETLSAERKQVDDDLQKALRDAAQVQAAFKMEAMSAIDKTKVSRTLNNLFLSKSFINST